MHVVLDHLSAILVGSVVLLMLLATQFQATAEKTDQQVYQASRRHAQAYTQQLEADVMNVGYGVAPGTAPVVSWTDSTFVFLRKRDTTAAAAVVTVAYLRRYERSVTMPDRTLRRLYRVDRTEDGVRTGGIGGILTAHTVALQRRNGTPTSVPAEAGAVRVAFEAVWGTRPSDLNQNPARVARTYYPPGLGT